MWYMYKYLFGFRREEMPFFKGIAKCLVIFLELRGPNPPSSEICTKVGNFIFHVFCILLYGFLLIFPFYTLWLEVHFTLGILFSRNIVRIIEGECLVASNRGQGVGDCLFWSEAGDIK
uniref:Uncharacterized protein n=1 Tax=Manihot esculenta TaxID=3983 RepID=A0A2C9WJE0_MANES